MARVQGMLYLVCGLSTLCDILLEAQASCRSKHQAPCIYGRKGSLYPVDQFTNGVSEEFAYCGGCLYNQLNEICCDNKIRIKPAAMARCCGKDAFDANTQLCCGPANDKRILNKISVHHLCCGYEQFNKQTQCCSDDLKVENHTNCDKRTTGRTSAMGKCGTNSFDANSQLCCGPANRKKILNKISVHHLCCGYEQFNKQTQCCSDDLKVENHTNCDKRTTGRTSVMEQCDHDWYDKTKELCCGPHGNKIILNKISEDHLCCGHSQYNTKTQCCTDALEVHNCSSNSCSQDARVPLEKHKCNRSFPKSCFCSSKCWKPNRRSGCEKPKTKSLLQYLSGRQSKPTVYNPKEKIFCNGCVSDRKPWMDQCCGVTPGVLCCNNTVHKDVQGQHCCGSSLYDPAKQICCSGHSYPKTLFHCCGESAYNISDPLKKCCGGTLYKLTKEQHNDTQCCGSLLKSKEEVCCLSEDKVMMYSAGEDFKCCGHHYYNTSLWSCHRGRLSPGQSVDSAESTLLSIKNLDKTELCNKIYFGAVQSVSLKSTVFSSVLEIHGERATLRHHVEPYVMTPENNGSILTLTLGKWYFFNTSRVFTDFNQDLLQESIFFILAKCFND